MVISTLNELIHLRGSDFGRPHPRHGLELLHWLARDCFYYCRNYATLLCEPQRGDYGFHYFENRENLLPYLTEGYSYYEVGNLNETAAQDLPAYVRKNHNWNLADSNSDRIILSVGPGNIIDRIYATEHQGIGSFDSERTYRISKGLMIIIKELELSKFLSEVGKSPAIRHAIPANSRPTVINMEATSPTPNYSTSKVSESRILPPRKKGFWESCTIL